MSDNAKDSGERHATMILSKSSHVTLTVGFAITIAAGVVAAAIWMTKIADDVGSIRHDLGAMAGELRKTSDDHELRLRELEREKRKP